MKHLKRLAVGLPIMFFVVLLGIGIYLDKCGGIGTILGLALIFLELTYIAGCAYE